MDVFAIATPEDRPDAPDYTAYVVDPEMLYPETVNHILSVLGIGTIPAGALRQYYLEAQRLNLSAWDLALTPLEACPAAQRIDRAQALELARLWFTELLHEAHGGPVLVHILANGKYRL